MKKEIFYCVVIWVLEFSQTTITTFNADREYFLFFENVYNLVFLFLQ